MSSLWQPCSVHYDIVVEVMDLLINESPEDPDTWQTIGAISRTCKSLRVEGVRRLLSSTVYVNLMHQPHLVSNFCDFMLSDPVGRGPNLRRLSVYVQHIEEEVARLFADVLSLSINLEYLEIKSLFMVTKPVIGTLCSALSALTSLQHLTIGFCRCDDPSYSQILYHTFQSIQSSLISVQISIPHFTKLPSRRIIYTRNLDPISLMSRLTGSLRKMGFKGMFMWGGGIRVYTLVEELQIPDYSLGLPHLRTYLLCFPNLRRLRCGFLYHTWIHYGHDTDVLQEVCCHAATIQQWHDFNKRQSSKHADSWAMLQSFRGSIVDAYVLSLPCRVEHLHLLSTGGRPSTQYAMMSTILSDTRPSSLRLCLRIYDSGYQIPLRPSWSQSLTTLEVRINIVKHMFDLQGCVVSHLTGMHLFRSSHLMEVI